MIYYRNGVSFAGEYRGKLVVEGICLIAVVCDWFVIYSQGGNVIDIYILICNRHTDTVCNSVTKA